MSHPEGPLEVDDTELDAVVVAVVDVVDAAEVDESADVAPTDAEVPPDPPVPPVNVNASPQPATATIVAARRPIHATHREAMWKFIVGLGSSQRMASVYLCLLLLRRKMSRCSRARPALYDAPASGPR